MKKINKNTQYLKIKQNLNIRKQQISKNSNKKILINYIKGLKNFNLLNKKYISK
jgi:hypothetical protein